MYLPAGLMPSDIHRPRCKLPPSLAPAPPSGPLCPSSLSLLWILLPFLLPTPAISQVPTPVLTTAREIAAHVTPKDAEPTPVRLEEATVTFLDPGNTIFLKDATGVTFIRAAKSNPRPAPGEQLRITGVTHNGLIIGGIKPGTIERLGRGVPPEPEAITVEELSSGRFHYHCVTLTGVGRSWHRLGENNLVLRLLSGGRTVELRFDEAPPDASAWIDAELRVSGLAAGDINDRRELVLPYLRMRSAEDLAVLAPAPQEPFAAAPLPLAELQRAIARPHRVKVRGTALGPSVGGGLFLRQEDGSVFVHTNAMEATTGDVVEALGFPEMGPFSAQLADAECRILGREAPPLPRPVSEGGLSDGCDADLITLEARLLQRIDGQQATELMAQAASISLSISSPTLLLQEAQPGALVRLTGLCRVAATRSDGYRARPTAYRLWLRAPEDLAVLQGTPWWTSQRLALAIAGVSTLALLAVLWATQLRRQVTRQLTVIEVKAQREAIVEERQRIAREFHDTLEQELAGLSLRLDAALPRVTDEKAHSLLDQQRRLLARLQTDTRDFVWDLRDSSRQDAPLDLALRSLVEHLQVNTTTPLAFGTGDRGDIGAGDERNWKLPPLIQHHLLRITREAVHNALKYAQAGGITVSLTTSGTGPGASGPATRQGGSLQLTIADDGRGFDPATAQALQGHFGIRGMHERARKIGATLEIQSEVGKGTCVTVKLPLPTS